MNLVTVENFKLIMVVQNLCGALQRAGMHPDEVGKLHDQIKKKVEAMDEATILTTIHSLLSVLQLS